MEGSSKKTGQSRLLRAFIAVPLDRRCQRQIGSLLSTLGNAPPGVRWEARNNRHLTLAFLGNTPEWEVRDLLLAFDDAYRDQRRFTFRFSALERFPGAAGRVVALTAEPTAPLDGLHQATLQLLRNLGMGFETRRFRPHVTLARIRQPAKVEYSFDRPLDIGLDVGSVTLYQSMPGKRGSIYTALKRVQLKE